MLIWKRDRIMDLDRHLNDCKNGNGASSEEVNRLKTRIRDLERSLEIFSRMNQNSIRHIKLNSVMPGNKLVTYKKVYVESVNLTKLIVTTGGN